MEIRLGHLGIFFFGFITPERPGGRLGGPPGFPPRPNAHGHPKSNILTLEAPAEQPAPAGLCESPAIPYAKPTDRNPRPAPSRGACLGEIEAKHGLPSADRNNKATLLLTGPFRTAKSSAKDLTPLVLKLQYAKYRDALRAPRRNRLLRR